MTQIKQCQVSITNNSQYGESLQLQVKKCPINGQQTNYEKKGCLAIGLTTQFLSCIKHLQLIVFICCKCYQISCKSCKSCNSLYIQCNSLQLITTQLQLCHNNSFSTTMQLPYDYNHNVTLTSFFIHPSKFNTWHYEDFFSVFWNIDIHHALWLFGLDGLGLWHVAQSNVAMWHIHWNLDIYIYIYMYLSRLVHSRR